MQTETVLIILLLAAYAYWYRAQQVKEIAFAATRRHCRECEVQMLDDCIALTHWTLQRGSTGKTRIARRYTFEFSATGTDRYQGICIMLGNEVQAFEMPAYRMPFEYDPF